MKKLVYVLLSCLILFLTVSVVSADVGAFCEVHDFKAPGTVIRGNSVGFNGTIFVYLHRDKPVLQGNLVRIYKSYSSGNYFGRWNAPTLIGTTLTDSSGDFSFTYTPTDTAYYMANCIYTPSPKIGSWPSDWIKVRVKNLPIIRPIPINT